MVLRRHAWVTPATISSTRRRMRSSTFGSNVRIVPDSMTSLGMILPRTFDPADCDDGRISRVDGARHDRLQRDHHV